MAVLGGGWLEQQLRQLWGGPGVGEGLGEGWAVAWPLAPGVSGRPEPPGAP